jgi:hypothetical protein
LTERRGKIHDAVKRALDRYFLTKKFTSTDIVRWVKWFCGTQGSPLFYKVPVPQTGVWNNREDPGYKVSYNSLFRSLFAQLAVQAPHGFLKSKFMISIGSRFLRDEDIEELRDDFGPPRGLFVLLMTAVS